MTGRLPRVILLTACASLVALLAVLALPRLAPAEQPFFSSRCETCHSDDTPTCTGCHEHRGPLSASTDRTSYVPGSPVVVTLHGGALGGWVRGLLYDQNATEIFRATGPTGSGDDGVGQPITLPVEMTGVAPATPGDYTWTAAWYGGSNSGSGHLEVSVPVVIHVAYDAAVPDDNAGLGLTSLRIAPNPMRDATTLQYTPSAGASAASLTIVDPTGRVIRRLSEGQPGADMQSLTWDGRDDAGRALPAGTYFAVLAEGGDALARPILVLR